MKRRKFLTVSAAALLAVVAAGCGRWQAAPHGGVYLGSAGSGAAVGIALAKEEQDVKREDVEVRPDDPKPRKVIIGTMCHAMWGNFPGLLARCEELGGLVDRVVTESNRTYGRGPDLVVLPEFALTDMSKPLAERALPVYSPGFNYFRNKARRHKAYIVVPAVVADGGLYHNSAVLFDRDGVQVGRYDKVHVCPDEPPARSFEGGLTPGRGYPVFECDFGKLGLQICLDYSFEEGWRDLARGGAELVVWPSQSPSVAITSARAVNNGLYIVSSTWRDNASIIEPIGTVAAQIEPPEKVLVREIDLEYRLIGWHGKLRDGAALKEKFGRRIGFNYYPREDTGVFWSNDPATPIDAMVRWLGIWTYDEYLAAQTERLEKLRETWKKEAAEPDPDAYAQWQQSREALDPLCRVVDLNVGQSQTVALADGSEATVKLIALDEKRDAVRDAVRRAEVAVEVNGHRTTLVSATYHLPVTVGGVQIDCPITRGCLSNSHGNPWAIDADARLRAWPAGSPWVRPGTVGYPVAQKWFATDTQMANEPTFVDGVESPATRRVYYHDGLDFGGSEAQVNILAVADGIILVAGEDRLPGYRQGGRYDRVVLEDARGWRWHYSHLGWIDPDIRPGVVVRKGRRLGTLGKEGGSGGWTHLHLGLWCRMPSGRRGSIDAYPFMWQAYREEHEPVLIGAARPHHLLWTGETARLDASRSWSASGKIAAYEWTFSDGTTAAGPTVDRTYDKAGVYSEVLKVTDAEGRAAWDFAVVQVIDREHGAARLPTGIHAVYYPTDGIRPGQPVTFKVRTFRSGAGEEVWDFGDGTPAVTTRSDNNADVWAQPGYAPTEHAFAKAGDYIVTVRATSEHGVPSTAHLWVHVEK